MPDSTKAFNTRGLTIDYRSLGTISILELAHAVFEDAHALGDIYNVRFVKAPRLRLIVTDEYGQDVKVMHPAGGTVRYLHTHHMRPVCKEYEL